MTDVTAALIADHIIDVPDFPQPGIVFKDLSPLLADGPAFAATVEAIVAQHRGFEVVAGIEARGFVIAAAVAYATGTGMVPIRKQGKLPRARLSADYALEYGQATLEVHADAFLAGQRVLLVDDVLATGGTVAAALGLIEQAGGQVCAVSVLLELGFLGGRERICGPGPRRDLVHALLTV